MQPSTLEATTLNTQLGMKFPVISGPVSYCVSVVGPEEEKWEKRREEDLER